MKLGLAPEETLLRLAWMSEREVSGGTMSQRTWYFYAYAYKVQAAREAAARHEYLMTDGVRWKFSTPVRRERGGSAWTEPAQWPPMPQPAASATSGLKPGTTPAGRQENERRKGLGLQAEWLKQASMPQREGEEMQAMLEKFKEEMKKDYAGVGRKGTVGEGRGVAGGGCGAGRRRGEWAVSCGADGRAGGNCGGAQGFEQGAAEAVLAVP